MKKRNYRVFKYLISRRKTNTKTERNLIQTSKFKSTLRLKTSSRTFTKISLKFAEINEVVPCLSKPNRYYCITNLLSTNKSYYSPPKNFMNRLIRNFHGTFKADFSRHGYKENHKNSTKHKIPSNQ